MLPMPYCEQESASGASKASSATAALQSQDWTYSAPAEHSDHPRRIDTCIPHARGCTGPLPPDPLRPRQPERSCSCSCVAIIQYEPPNRTVTPTFTSQTTTGYHDTSRCAQREPRAAARRLCRARADSRAPEGLRRMKRRNTIASFALEPLQRLFRSLPPPPKGTRTPTAASSQSYNPRTFLRKTG